MYPSVIKVSPLKDYKLSLEFDNNETRVFDVSYLLDIGRFKELTDVNLFNTVKVSFDSIEWINGIDLDPEALYSKSELA